MRGVVLPGRRTVAFRDVDDPAPGPGQVVLGVRASGLCGSDLRVIYRREPGQDTPYRDGVVAGHEPAGEVLAVGAGVRSVREGDRVAVYHIAGCGQCVECRAGWQVACESPNRSAYGYHRDGGHAPYLLAEEGSLVPIPEPLSYVDGALASCGLGTAYQGVLRTALSARDRVLVVGLGPLGLGVALLASALGAQVVAVDTNPGRRDLAATVLECRVYAAGAGIAELLAEETGGHGFEVAFDCTGSAEGRSLTLHAARRRARVVFLGEGGEFSFAPSPLLIHKEISLLGSWVCNIASLNGLFEFLGRTGVAAGKIVTHCFAREDAERAYRMFDEGRTGKVIVK